MSFGHGHLCAGRLLPLYIVQGGFNGQQYRDVLRDLYWPALQEHFGARTFRYVQDNAPAHKSLVVRNWCAESAPRLADAFWQLPAYSPDLNPIEHVWARMKAGLRGKNFHSQESLLLAVREQYQLVGADTRFLQNLCASMPRRISAVIAAEGGPTRY
jgi:transposase